MASIEFEPRPGDRSLRRLEIVLYACLAWAIIIGARLVYLQTLAHENYTQLADKQQQRLEELPARRGEIFDRAYQPLAITVPVKTVVVNPRLFPKEKTAAVTLLAGFLKLDPRRLTAQIEEAAAKNRGFLKIAQRVSIEDAGRVAALKLTGVDFRDETIRAYPKGSLAAHVLGGVNHEEKGNAGIELALNKELQGIAGLERLMTDVSRHGYDSVVERKPHPGKNLALTIDERVQYVTEEALREAMLGCRCKTGSVVVMNPSNGDILAMANYPTYDPNVAPKNGADPARLNLAVSAPYEPGSVFKLITLSGALERTRMGPDTPVNCLGGRITLYGRTIREAKNGYGVIPMRTVLAKSSNVGAIQIGLAMGPKNLYESIRAFGFGSRTGVDLPAESPGLVRPVNRWGKTTIGSVPMGHEILTTSLQLAQATAALANDGVMMKPRIVLARQAQGEPWQPEPVPQGVRVMTSRNAALMRDMMRDVVRKGGTGVAAKVLGYTTGGKTGSAQMLDEKTRRYLHGKYNASFVGMAPVNKPAVVVVVTLTGSSEYGGRVAAPVFKKVAESALRILDVPMDDRESLEDAAAPAREEIADGAVMDGATAEAVEKDEQPAQADQVMVAGLTAPNFLGRSLREVLLESASTGVAVETHGTGVSRVQRPPPGEPMRPGQTIQVQFGK